MEIITTSKPIEDGYFMPAEFSPHEGTLMIYPTRPGSWGKDRTQTLESFGSVFIQILKRENLYLLVSRDYICEADSFIDELITSHCRGDELLEKELSERCYILEIDSDDAWARDVGPTFVVSPGRDIRGINWSFNAWGGEVDGLYANWDRDDKVALKFLETIEADAYDAAPFVLEGGSIHCDGEGTVMVTES